MEIVKGVLAGQAMKHKLGRVVQKFPPEVRVSRKDKVKLHKIVSKMSKDSAARRNGTNGVGAHPEGQAVLEAMEAPTTQRLLTDEHLAFFKRVAADERCPKDIRTEAFTYSLAD